jgi:hypothetical protein
MSDLDFCKTRLEEIVDHTASPAKLLVKVQEFVAHRLPEKRPTAPISRHGRKPS